MRHRLRGFMDNTNVILINDLRRSAEIQKEIVSEALLRVMHSGWYILGEETRNFESMFASYLGVNECIGVGNGTDALEIAFRGLGLSDGDGIVTVANAGMYTTTAAKLVGCLPVYCDIRADSMLIDPNALLTIDVPNVKGVVVTHLYGQIADMPAILDIAEKREWWVIEDCAQAHGASLDGKRAGSWGHVSTFSFYPTKNLGALGDGGAIATNDADLADMCRKLRQYGWNGKYKVSVENGRNSRLDEIQAAILCAKLPYLDSWNERRRRIAHLYANHISRPDIILPILGGKDHVHHLYVVRTRRRDQLRTYLQNQNIATDVHYPVPDHRQSAWNERSTEVSLPVSEELAQQILTLPCHPDMTDEEVLFVADAVQRWDCA